MIIPTIFSFTDYSTVWGEFCSSELKKEIINAIIRKNPVQRRSNKWTI